MARRHVHLRPLELAAAVLLLVVFALAAGYLFLMFVSLLIGA